MKNKCLAFFLISRKGQLWLDNFTTQLGYVMHLYNFYLIKRNGKVIPLGNIPSWKTRGLSTLRMDANNIFSHLVYHFLNSVKISHSEQLYSFQIRFHPRSTHCTTAESIWKTCAYTPHILQATVHRCFIYAALGHIWLQRNMYMPKAKHGKSCSNSSSCRLVWKALFENKIPSKTEN